MRGNSGSRVQDPATSSLFFPFFFFPQFSAVIEGLDAEPPSVKCWAFFSPDLSQFLEVGFVIVNEHCPVFFFSLVCSSFSTKSRMQKNSVFLAASFGDLLLNEKGCKRLLC